jgi:OOP family OmpA-OmpF porin
MAEPPEQSNSLGAAQPTDGAEPGNASVVAPEPPRGASSRSGVRAGLQGAWTLLVRLLILGFGVSLGWTVGVLVAQVWPGHNPHPPLSEVALRRTSQTWKKVRQLPRWWRGSGGIAPAPDLASQRDALAPAPEPPPALSPEQRQQATTDLARLQTELDALSGDLGALEARLGQSSGGGVETRMQQLQQRINPSALPAPTLPPPLAASSPAEVYVEPSFSPVSDRIVLPSSLLFEPGGSDLTVTGQQLLSTIVPDLQRYPAATLVVGSHTASDNEPLVDRQLTWQQAAAVQGYLAQQLEATGLHWVTIGYGQTRPRVAGPSPAAQQRNQRVEIGIVPE